MFFARKTLKFFLLAPSALAMSSQSFCLGGARKTTIREPLRLAHFKFSTAFVNGGLLQDQIRGKLDVFCSKNPQIFLARAFGARYVFTVILLGSSQ